MFFAWVRYTAKALFAGVVALLGPLITAFTTDGVDTFADLTQLSWLTIGLATIVAVGGVFGLGNGPKPGGNNDG